MIPGSATLVGRGTVMRYAQYLMIFVAAISWKTAAAGDLPTVQTIVTAAPDGGSPPPPLPGASLSQPEGVILADEPPLECTSCEEAVLAHRPARGCGLLWAFRPPNAALYQGYRFDYRRVYDYPWEMRPSAGRRCWDCSPVLGRSWTSRAVATNLRSIHKAAAPKIGPPVVPPAGGRASEAQLPPAPLPEQIIGSPLPVSHSTAGGHREAGTRADRS